MKKFGIGRKQGGEDDDSSRSRLFGSKSRSSGSGASTPASANPYAVGPSNVKDPYAQPQHSYQPSQYSTSAASSSTQLPPYDRGYTASPRQHNSYASPPPSQSQDARGGYGSYGGGGYDNGDYGSASASASAARSPGYSSQGNYSSQGGYGSSRYDNNSNMNAPSGSAGYGGMGQSRSAETEDADAGRDALFGNAKDRYQQQQQQSQSQLPPEDQYGSGGYGESGESGYGQEPPRELTAEEQEEEDVRATKDQIRHIKQQDVSSTRNALRIAQQAEETGRATLERLGQQGERIHNTERYLDDASRENRMAAEKASELKTLTRSMFAVHMNNPFTKGQRERDREAKLMQTHQGERDQQGDTRAHAYASMARQRELERQIAGSQQNSTFKKRDLAERSKYQFEADSEDEAMEDEIDNNLHALHGASKNLHLVAKAMGTEIDSQNKHIDRITGKAEKVDDGIVLNRARLDRIH